LRACSRSLLAASENSMGCLRTILPRHALRRHVFGVRPNVSLSSRSWRSAPRDLSPGLAGPFPAPLRHTLGKVPLRPAADRDDKHRAPRTPSLQSEGPQNKAPEPSSIRAHSDYYPTGAVWVDIPFPYGNGRVTAAGASDFQLRHVIFP
jgi:hypothetical protein